MIKEFIDLDYLADKLLEKRIIDDNDKKDILDEHSKRTTMQRIDKLLNYLIASIRFEGSIFGDFIDIIKQKNTRGNEKLAGRLMDSYKMYASN